MTIEWRDAIGVDLGDGTVWVQRVRLHSASESPMEPWERAILALAAERDRLAADLARAKELQERMLDCLQNIRDNYDHEEYTHEHRPGYGGICRVCSAERVIGVRQ